MIKICLWSLLFIKYKYIYCVYINSNRQIKAREEQNEKSREKRLFRCGYSVWHKRFGRA